MGQIIQISQIKPGWARSASPPPPTHPTPNIRKLSQNPPIPSTWERVYPLPTLSLAPGRLLDGQLELPVTPLGLPKTLLGLEWGAFGPPMAALRRPWGPFYTLLLSILKIIKRS